MAGGADERDAAGGEMAVRLLPEVRRCLVDHQLLFHSGRPDEDSVGALSYRRFDEPLDELSARAFDVRRLAMLAAVSKRFDVAVSNRVRDHYVQAVVAEGHEPVLILETKAERLFCAYKDIWLLRRVGVLDYAVDALQLFHGNTFPDWILENADFHNLEQLSIAPVHPSNPEHPTVQAQTIRLIVRNGASLRRLRCNQALLKKPEFPHIHMDFCGSSVLRLNNKFYGLRPPSTQHHQSPAYFSILARSREVGEVKPVENLLKRPVSTMDLEGHPYSVFARLRSDFLCNPAIEQLNFGWEWESLGGTVNLITMVENHAPTVKRLVFTTKHVSPNHVHDFDYVQLENFVRNMKQFSEIVANSRMEIAFSAQFWLIKTKLNFLRFQHEDGLYSKQIQLDYGRGGFVLRSLGQHFSVSLSEFDEVKSDQQIRAFAQTLKATVSQKDFAAGPHKLDYV